MTTINIYLTFNGNCEEAFLYYQSIFGGDFATMSKFNEMPPDPKFTISESDKEKIMHVSLPISSETVLMGSDVGGDWSPPFSQGNNFSISINTDTREKADAFFEKLANGGKITMPLQDTFWGSYFGSVVDKFGISWMVSVETNSKK